MLRSIQIKIVAMFVLLILSVIIVIGSFLLINITDFYNNEFYVMMEQVLNDDLNRHLDEMANGSDDVSHISETLFSYIGPLGIDTYRFYSLLDADNMSVLATSDTAKGSMEITDNIITAMTGIRGNLANPGLDYMDYALPIKKNNEVKYILYIKDTKNELHRIMQNIFYLMMQALFFGIIFAVLTGYLLSRTITVPIINLTKKAERMAKGKFDNIPPVYSNDEIGRLSKTFYTMSLNLTESLKEISGEKAKMEEIFRNITDGILAFNTNGEVIHINPVARDSLCMYDIDEADFDDLFKDVEPKITIGDLLYIEQDNPIERIYSTIDGKFLRLNFAAFYSENDIDGVVVVIHNDTKQQKLELSRKEFVANVSHELRTPLTTIKSYTETLLDTPNIPEPMSQKFLKVIENEADRMTRIVKDLLTLSHLDSNMENKGFNEDIDVSLLVEKVVQNISINANNKNQTIFCHAAQDIPMIKGNRDRLEQVIVNIISNAIKYTGEGGNIEISTGRIYQDIYIKVKDDGIGIPEENMPHIFERFYRVDKARSRETGGTGLGLSIAKQIVEAFGGSIKVTSEYTKGTEVIITLPY